MLNERLNVHVNKALNYVDVQGRRLMAQTGRKLEVSDPTKDCFIYSACMNTVDPLQTASPSADDAEIFILTVAECASINNLLI